MNKKRGQITIFIIIGIIVLFSVGAIFLIQSITEEGVVVEEGPRLKKLPEELLPVRGYVDNCIHDIAVEGLLALGEHGGYIDIKDTANGVTFDVSPISPTDSDAVEFLPDTGFIIPYWTYVASPNKNKGVCAYASKRPPLKKNQATAFVPPSAAIELQLERYMDENLKSCVEGFYSLERKGFEIEEGDVTTEVIVADHDVLFTVTFPLEIVMGSSRTSVDKFFVKIPLELKRMYELAHEMVRWQENSSYLETHALSLIGIFSGLESNDLPPTSEYGFDFGGGKMWAKSKVKQDVISLLTTWVKGLRVFGSYNYRFITADPDSPYAEPLNRIYGNMVLPIMGYNDILVDFDYLGWPIYFDIPSAEGQLIKPESISSNLLSAIGYQQYQTIYDISFPVYVGLKTLPTLDFPMGYRFLFLMEANVRNSDAFSCGVELEEIPRGAMGNLLCNENQRISGDVVVTVVEKYSPPLTDEVDPAPTPIPRVLISYSLGDSNCVYEKTDINGQLKIKIPPALGGAIRATKQGYLGGSVPISLEFNQTGNVTIEMYKKKMMDITAKRLVYGQGAGTALPLAETTPIKLDKDEEITLILKRKKEGQFEEKVEVAGRIVPGEQLQLELVPGEYEVEALLMLNKRVIIPAQERDDYTTPMIDIKPPFLWGGVNTAQFIIKENKLYNYDELQFVVLSFPTPTMHEHIEWMGQVEAESEKYELSLKPKFRKRVVVENE